MADGEEGTPAKGRVQKKYAPAQPACPGAPADQRLRADARRRQGAARLPLADQREQLGNRDGPAGGQTAGDREAGDRLVATAGGPTLPDLGKEASTR